MFKTNFSVRKHFFTFRVTEPWHKLPREAGEFPSLGIKLWIHGQPVLCGCAVAGDWTRCPPTVTSNLDHSVVL